MLRIGFLILLVLSFVAPVYSAEFHEEVERDFPLRSIGQLNLTNMRGDLTIQGWALDKIRVKARRTAIAETAEEAKQLFSAIDFRYRMLDRDIELSAEYGRGLSIEARLKEREHPKTGMQMTVYAPANLKLRVWAVDGKATVKSWNAPVEVRTAAGPIFIENVKADHVSLLCPTCPMTVKSVRGSVRCMGGTGDIALDQVAGAHIYVESSSGALRLNGVKGEQLYVSKSGAVTGRVLDGRMEFHTQQASVELTDASGFLSGRTETGDISAKMRRWNFSDKALVESVQGNISLHLPFTFSGDVDIWSQQGKTDVTFPVRKNQEKTSFGPEPMGRVLGKVGDGGELLKVYSEKGDVRVSRGSLD